jgi:hypothetical protein
MRVFKDLVVIAVGFIAALYLIYPSFGWLEFIPDAMPLVGSMDEATATLLLVSAFRYFGLDLAQLFKRNNTPDTIELPPPAAKDKRVQH